MAGKVEEETAGSHSGETIIQHDSILKKAGDVSAELFSLILGDSQVKVNRNFLILGDNNRTENRTVTAFGFTLGKIAAM
ncbi:hypothetical protein HCBG_01880 [Histoplasma capsulatum G186AR]|uniref:Uncharacterized protein n=1 Tax=Ajellomyces capsulatus (strain G186AR / H82 / ATCC MYA-2454 / RMSCC 2432) TaxID=447093 RepID=C0NG64_AJECG|nr:uncharacterized protein HCBG_01880 [Histoplasma capsulatum G186AR]EEH10235.1 hypothetical protein HCBG_01880 [Histoplasma capsulatum G186AR]